MGAPYWSNSSLFFYIILALVGMLCLIKVRNSNNHKIGVMNNPYAIIWIVVWTFFAVFRVVKPGLGGSDAIDYISYYSHCNDSSLGDLVEIHTSSDLLYRWINQLFRYITPDYHLMFFFIYFFLVWSIIVFIKEYSRKQYSIAPFILVFYLYLRGFSSIRSNMALSFLLIGLVCLSQKRKFLTILMLICAVLTHKAAIVFALVIPFCAIYSKKAINFKKVIVLVGVSYVLALFLRPYFVTFGRLVDLGGAYASYAEILMENSMFSWVNDVGQMLLGVVLLLKSRRIIEIVNSDRSLILLWNICAFDLLCVPINQLMGIYRGYEFFYVARLCMWSFLIYISFMKQHKAVRVISSSMFFCIFLAWMIFRISRTYEDTMLMPYLFDFDYLFGI